MIWLFQFAKAGRIKTMAEAIKAFFKINGRMPSSKEIKTMTGVMREATGKTADVIPFPKGRITDPFKPRPGDPKYADSVIKDLKSRDPIDAMKEANSIIGRKNPSYKGPYKNLSDDEVQRILKETDDHIFQRDIKYDEFGDPIKPDPEDFASGGRVSYTKGGLAHVLGV